MKKILVLIMTCLILTSCTSNLSVVEEISTLSTRKLGASNYIKSRNTYIEDEMKDTVEEINNLKEKYKDSLNEDEYYYLNIDIYDKEDNGFIQDVFTINNIYDKKKYFDEVVEILDTRVAKGLKDYVKKAYEMNLDFEKIIIKKIGKVVVHVDNRGGFENNYIAIRMRITDIKDEDYKKIFEEIFEDKYILSNIYTETKIEEPLSDELSRDLISFVNDGRFMNDEDSPYVKIRYETLLKDKEIDKVNILLSRRQDEKLKKEDIEVFVNLLSRLDIGEADRGKLVGFYRNIFEEKIDKNDLEIDGYKIYVKTNKGNNYIGEKKQNIYLSIEKE